MKNAEAKRLLLKAGFEIIKSTDQFDCFCYDDDLRVVVARRSQVENPHTTREVEMMLRRAEVRKAENAAKAASGVFAKSKKETKPEPKPLTQKIAERLDINRSIATITKQAEAEPEPNERICAEHGMAKKLCAEKGLPHSDQAAVAPPKLVTAPAPAAPTKTEKPPRTCVKMTRPEREKMYARIEQLAADRPISASTLCDLLDQDGFRYPSGASARSGIWHYVTKINERRTARGLPLLQVTGQKGNRKLPVEFPEPSPSTVVPQVAPPAPVAPPPPPPAPAPLAAAAVTVLGSQIPAVVHQLLTDPSLDDAKRLQILRIVAKLPTSIELMMDDPELGPSQKLDVIRLLMVKA